MLSFVETPRIFQVLLMIALLIAMSGILALRLSISASRRTYYVWHYSQALWLATFVDLVAVYSEFKTGVPLTNRIPVLFHWMFIAMTIVLTISGEMGERRLRKNMFSRGSIKEAIDNIPIGLCFSNKKGRIILANRSFYHIMNRLTDSYVSNAETMWENLQNTTYYLDATKLIEYSNQDMISLETKNQNVYQIMRRPIMIDMKVYYETKIYMVTRLHDLKEEVSAENDRLKEQHREIRNLTSKMIKNNHEEELLNRKIQIHNTMGEYILATRQLLTKESTREEYYKMAIDWQNMTRQFVSVEDQYKKNSSELLREILTVANDIGCEVIISDEIDGEIFEMPLARQAVREAVINAVRHGQASCVHIDTDKDVIKPNLVISNNGVFDENNKIPQGGLKNLQDALRAGGGSLEIITDKEFTVKIVL